MTKTKIKERPQRDYDNCVAYREELEELHDVFKRGDALPRYECDGYHFDNVEDLCEHLGSKGTGQLKIETMQRPHMWFSTDVRGGVNLSLVTTDDNAAYALFHRAEEVFKQIGRRRPWFGNPLLFPVGLALGGLGWGISKFANGGSPYLYLAVALDCAALTLFFANTLYRPAKRTRFYGVLRRDQKSYWERKGEEMTEKVVLLIIGGVLGIAGTLTTQYAKDRLAESHEHRSTSSQTHAQ